MKKIHKKVIQAQARKFNKMLKYVKNVTVSEYGNVYKRDYNTSFSNGVNPNTVSRNSRRLKASTKAKIVRLEIAKWGPMHHPGYSFKDRIFLEVTGRDADVIRKLSKHF